MKICLFCENQYAIGILMPLQEEADREGGNDVLWYVHEKKIPDFPLKNSVKYTNSIQEIKDFHPDAIFVPGNIVPYYLSGVKIEIFHGYAEKRDQFVIRRYFDTYFTQGPFYTNRFKELAKKYKDFEVLETGWTRQDWVFRNLHSYDDKRSELLRQYGKSKILLYAPTFSKSMTSLPFMQDALRGFAQKEDAIVLIKLHPLTQKEIADDYRKLASEVNNIVFIDDYSITPYVLMSDCMLSDTSSTIYEELLMNKPVITLRTTVEPHKIYWRDMQEPDELQSAYHDVMANEGKYAELRQEVINNYDPYLDGKVAHRMLEGARDYIKRHGVPEKRKLNLWRKYTSIKTFGWPK